jgi:uncharacterized protein
VTLIPHDQLRPETLEALVEEFVTRDGAVQGHTDTPLATRMAAVLRQLRSGKVVIVFDEASESCTMMCKDDLPPQDVPDEVL